MFLKNYKNWFESEVDYYLIPELEKASAQVQFSQKKIFLAVDEIVDFVSKMKHFLAQLRGHIAAIMSRCNFKRKRGRDFVIITVSDVPKKYLLEKIKSLFSVFGMIDLSFLRVWGRQMFRIGALAVFLFVIGFFGMNAPAYSQIMQAWFNQVNFNRFEVINTDEFVQNRNDELLAVSSVIGEDDILSAFASDGILNNYLSVLPPDSRLIIPKIGKNVPIIFSDPQKLINADWSVLEKIFQGDLKKGVIYYPGTAVPGEKGNGVITGHSSYYLWDDGSYKDVFVLLHTLAIGDEIVVQFKEKEYHYIVDIKDQIKNTDISILKQPKDESRITLITCTPVGTNLRRLVVGAKLVEVF